jgi:acetolactate synthase-1/2/3 large subunit
MAIRRTMGQSDIDAIGKHLKKAKRPIILAGGSGWTDEACAALMTFAEKNSLPIVSAFRRQDLCDHRHPCYAGELGTGPNPALVEQFKTSDLVIAIGTRLGEIVTQGYTLLDLPKPKQTLIHINASGGELGKVFKPALKIQADHGLAAIALSNLAVDGKAWAGWTQGLRANYEAWTSIDMAAQPNWNGANMTAIFGHLRDTLPANAIVTTDAGNFSGWAQRYLRYGRPGRLLAPTSGAMGYGVPSAIGASLAHPDRTVLGLCGDGGFMMTGQELATAMHHGAKPVIMICNNGMYGTIRMHQEKNYPGRVSATALTNPDFVALVESYGAFSTRVHWAADFPAAWDAARNARRLAVIEVAMDPRQITTNSRLL